MNLWQGASIKAVYGKGTTTVMGENFLLPLTPLVKCDIGFSAVRYEGQTITETNASFNRVSGVGEIEGGVNNAEGVGLYGGADDNDNFGVLRYVRIKTPAIRFFGTRK